MAEDKKKPAPKKAEPVAEKTAAKAKSTKKKAAPKKEVVKAKVVENKPVKSREFPKKCKHLKTKRHLGVRNRVLHLCTDCGKVIRIGGR